MCTAADHAALLKLKSDPVWLRAHSTPNGLMVDRVDDVTPVRLDFYEHRNYACSCGVVFTWSLLAASVEVES